MLIKIHVSTFFFSFHSFHSASLFLRVSGKFTAPSCCAHSDDEAVLICVGFCVYRTFSPHRAISLLFEECEVSRRIK